eukprot:3466027-Rhodomonas_salina.2
MAIVFHLFNTACIEILSWNLVRHLIVVVLLLVTANIGPNSVVWIAVGVLLASCNQCGRITRKEINSMYFQTAPVAQEKSQTRKFIYKLKPSRERFRYKVLRSVPIFSATCRISTPILMAANASAEAALQTYIDSGCAITIINDCKLLHNIRQIKPIVVQGVTGERTINQAGNLHLPAVSNDCVARTIIITGVLLDELSPVNLVSADQLR